MEINLPANFYFHLDEVNPKKKNISEPNFRGMTIQQTEQVVTLFEQ